jgi:hypothetical protein
MRLIKTIGLVIGVYILAIAIDLVFASSSSEYQGGVTFLVILGFLGFLAPKVGYRWFDCFFALIPFYGIFFIFKIAHRVAFLPNRDWAELPVN